MPERKVYKPEEKQHILFDPISIPVYVGSPPQVVIPQ